MTNHFDNFEERNKNRESIDTEGQHCQSAKMGSDSNASGQRDRFELLSAYLDGEVTASERRQVEQWLATDSQTQRLYARLLALRQNLQTLPIARSGQSVDQLVDRVTARIERSPRRLVWGGLAAAALIVGALFNALPNNSYAPSVADSLSQNEDVPSDGLMIALNRPPIEIPKAAVATPASLQEAN